jgi:uncharacterized membrane protein
MDEAITKAPAAPRVVAAGRGVYWWSEAWAMFTKNAGLWVVMGVLLIIIYIVLSIIPFLGSIVASLLLPVFLGGWLLAARKAQSGGALEIGDLFAGFKDKLIPLLVLGALTLVATVVIFAVVGMLGFGAFMGMMAGSAHSNAAGVFAAVGAGLLALLVGLALGMVVAMAIWFAPALVVFRGVAPVDALSASMSASLKNVMPFLLYGLIYIVAAIVASIPFALGWLVLVPVTLLTLLVSYEDVFGA